MNMRNRFLSLARTHDASAETAERWWRDLERRYSEPHRHYHTLAHIEQILDVLPHATETVLAAAWFHDAIYGGSANEERSADLARQSLMELRFPDDEIPMVERLIVATKTHEAGDLPLEGQRFLDADLSILGSERERYRRYVEEVRQEYAQVPEAIFRDGRNRILRRLLERPRIYATEEFFAPFEVQARVNIEWELNSSSFPAPRA